MREILKQERLAPQSNLSQLAWLIAFNGGLFDEANPSKIPLLLQRIETGIKTTALTLASPTEQWLLSLSDWFKAAGDL